MENKKGQPRRTYRCTLCLCLYVITYEQWKEIFGIERGAPHYSKISCGVCNHSQLECLGEIGKDNTIEKDEEVCNCDNRCVWASGPNCNCICGGENHQAGIFGYTEIKKTRPMTLVEQEVFASGENTYLDYERGFKPGEAILYCSDENIYQKYAIYARDFKVELIKASLRQNKMPWNLAQKVNQLKITEWIRQSPENRRLYIHALEADRKFKRITKYKNHALRIKRLTEIFPEVSKKSLDSFKKLS